MEVRIHIRILIDITFSSSFMSQNITVWHRVYSEQWLSVQEISGCYFPGLYIQEENLTN
jgi:hypothetical protein